MNRRQFFQALGSALVLPHEPKIIYSFPTSKVELVAIDLETSSLDGRGIRENMVTYDKLSKETWGERVARELAEEEDRRIFDILDQIVKTM